MLRDNITGFILAGGRSRRMGRDKARTPWNNGTLLSHAVEDVSRVATRVFVVGALDFEDPPVSVLADSVSGGGPLGGIHAALRHSETDWNLMVAVDVPLVTAGLLGFVAGFCPSNAKLVVVPKIGGKLQPLCAAYHRALLPQVENALDSGQLSIHRLLEGVGAGIVNDPCPGNMYVIEEQELLAAGFAPEMFLNVNTPEDLERAQALAKTLHV